MAHTLSWRAIVAHVLTAAALTLSIVRHSEAAKPPKVTPPRPILYFRVNSARTGWAIRRTDEAGTSDIVVNASGALTYGGRARFSPDGLLIGGYHAQVAGGEGIMVMKADGRRVIYNRTVWDSPNRNHDELMMIDSVTRNEAMIRSGEYIELPDWSPFP
jgi:hypothetical protein